MNIPKEIIQKAIEGGWIPRSDKNVRLSERVMDGWSFRDLESPKAVVWWMHDKEIALDATFWQALGEALGWELYTPSYEYDGEVSYHATWHEKARQFYDLILQGQSTTDYWNNILGA